MGTAHQRKNRPARSMVGIAHPTKIALLQLVQDVSHAMSQSIILYRFGVGLEKFSDVHRHHLRNR